MSAKTLTRAPLAQRPIQDTDTRPKSPCTNMEAWNSPLVTEAQRARVNTLLGVYGAAPLRATHTSETVARKAIRVALRERGLEASVAREMAVSIIAAARIDLAQVVEAAQV